jgi:hypothetical protein
MLAAAPAAGGEGPRPAAPEGAPTFDRERMREIFTKRRNGEELTEDEEKLMAQMRQQMAGRGGPPGTGRPGGEGPRRRTSAVSAQLGGDYMVFALRGGEPTALRIRTGITDLDYAEVVAGLDDDDEVLILPSASLVRAQESFQQRISSRMGIPGLSNRSGGSRGGRSSND